jgi:hypothetical protein
MAFSHNLLDDGEKERKLNRIYNIFFDKMRWSGNPIPPLYQADLCLIYIRSNNLQAEVDLLIDEVKEGRFGSLTTNDHMRLFCECFPELVRSRFEGFNRRRMQGNTFTWVFFPFDRAISRFSELDGFEFDDADFKMTENKTIVSTMVVKSDEARIDKDAVTASIEFNQLCDPTSNGSGSYVWHTEEPKKFEDEIGVCKTAIPGLNGTTDLREVIPAPPSGYKKVDNHPVTYVYDYLMSQDPFIRTELINTITVNRWMRTVTDKQLSTCYTVEVDGRGFYKIVGRNVLAMKPIGSIQDSRLFSEIDNMNARVMRSGILHMWYFALSIMPEHKEVIENVKFIGKYASEKADIIGIHHAVNFAATWTKSGINKRPYVYTKAIFPKSSVVLSKTELDGACGGSAFVFTAKISFNKKDNETARADHLMGTINKLVMKLKGSYNKFYVRVSIQFLEIDKLDDFIKLGVGFVKDVDPLSGWIWVTNDESAFPHEVVIDANSKTKMNVYNGGSAIRKVLCECLSARFMVEQTHTGYGTGFRVIAKWPKVIFKQDFENEEEIATLVGQGDLKKLDGIVAGPGAARVGIKNPFQMAAGANVGLSVPTNNNVVQQQAVNPFANPVTNKSSSMSFVPPQKNPSPVSVDDGFTLGFGPLNFNSV